MQNKIYIKYVLINLVLALISVVLVIFYKDTPNINMEKLLLLCYGGAGFLYNEFDLIQTVILIIPLLIHLTFYLRVIPNDLDKSAVYIFTRANKRTTWYGNKILFIFSLSFLFYLFQFIGAMLWGLIFGIRIESIVNIFTVISLLLITVGLFHTGVIFLGNVLAIYIKPNFIYLVIVICNLAQLFILPIISKPSMIKWLPISQSILSFHEVLLLKKMVDIELLVIENFTLHFSVIYSMLIIFVITILGGIVITKKDLY